MSTLNNTYVNEIPIVNMPQIIEKLENITKGINTKAKADANAAAKAKRNAVAKARANAAAKAKANAEEKNRAAIRDLQNKTRKQINETEKALYGNGANRRPTRTGGASRKLNRRVNAALAAAESIGNPTGSATSSAGSAASSP
jgi:colicin import membrane protein